MISFPPPFPTPRSRRLFHYLQHSVTNPQPPHASLPKQRYYIWKAAQAKAQSAVWTDPRGYYFLNITVVLPKAQGTGIGRLLMEAVTDRADAEGMPCYLESSRAAPNIQIYERFGFEFATELECRDDETGDAIKLFSMVRQPRSNKSGA